jgi:hypothetical protein
MESKSRSEADAALIFSLLNSGFTVDQIIRWILSSNYPSHIRERGENAVREEIERCARKARLRVNSTWRGEALALALACRAWAESRAWPGRTGMLGGAVFLALVAIAKRAGKPDSRAAFFIDAQRLARGIWTRPVVNATGREISPPAAPGLFLLVEVPPRGLASALFRASPGFLLQSDALDRPIRKRNRQRRARKTAARCRRPPLDLRCIDQEITHGSS